LDLDFSYEQAILALELAEGKRDTALDLLLAGAIQPTSTIDGEGADSGRLIFARGRSGNFDKKLTKQLKTLENLHPEYRRSRRWQLKVPTPGGTVSRKLAWTREATLATPEASETEGFATRVPIQGWVRSFRPDGSLEFVTTAEGASFRDAASITDEQMTSLVEARELPFPDKTAWFREQIQKARLIDSWDNRFEMTLRRDSLWEDSFSQLADLPGKEWRRPFNLHFEGELGHDAGGLTREWFSIILRQALSEEFGMFKFSATDNITYQLDEASTTPLPKYTFLGRCLGKAVLEGHAIGVHLTVPTLKMICGAPVVWTDLQFKDYQMYLSFQQLLQMNPDVVQHLAIDFSLPPPKPGMDFIELKPGGAEVGLTGDNLEEYIELVTKYKLLNSVAAQLGALLGGVYDVVPEQFLAVFDFSELELFLGGCPEIDVDDWRSNTVETGKELALPGNAEWFWEIVAGWSHEQRAKFLQFVTGTSQVPLGGFSKLAGHLGEIKKFELKWVTYDAETSRYPRGHTCFNRLDIPAFPNREEMQLCVEAVLNIDVEHLRFGLE